MRSKTVTPLLIAKHARQACLSFAAYEKRFFNFEKRNGWAGWENWLTIDILRRLNVTSAEPYAPYPNGKQRFDILVDEPRIVVEIKVTYIDRAHVKKFELRGRGALSGRLTKDAKKVEAHTKDSVGLLMLAVAFEHADLIRPYKTLVNEDIKDNYSTFKTHRWFNCSAEDGCVSLLALTTGEKI